MSKVLSKEFLQRWAPLIVLFSLCIIVSIINPNFLSVRNFARLATSSAAPLMLAIGVTFIIIMGSIDLSMEGVMAFCGASLAVVMLQFNSFVEWGFLAIPVAIVFGVAIGFVNGLIHVKLKIPSFLVSLGIGFSCIGLTMVMTGGVRVSASDKAFRLLLTERFFGFPLMVYVAFAALLLAYFIQKKTALGRNLYAIGGGEELAHASGVKVERVRIIAFALAGAFYALGAMFAVAQIGSVASNLGTGFMFVSITSVVVGGTALMGGIGGVWQTLVGVLIVAVISNGMVLVGLPTYIQEGVLGVLVILAVALATNRKAIQLVK
ncbi:ABC transporter permease [Marinobacterium nitratireducens]|uniref:ABC transporter permease n=1 Tax=Marinobacterium nitratireducens TaxID=518897 RepID=A0A917ZKP2_9GAMM|nr:ABC transporter permease [Marinobacterium nitratireducens]GGO83880.1 ABC transporter permease [Marinobacterium nitratireducens]